jgi:hypothetical protein
MNPKDVIRETNGTDCCHIWEGCKDRFGYGYVGINGQTHRVHRHAYAHYHDLTMEDISGVVIRHTCDNPSCANPKHLLAGTQTDNMRDKIERGRQTRRETSPYTKLTEEEANAVMVDPRSQQKIAKAYGIGQTTVWRIKNGKRWRS